MILLRSALFNVYAGLVTVPLALLAVFTFPFKAELRYWLIARQWAKAIIWGAKVICGIRYEVKGWDNVPHHGVIFAPKHQSRWETMALPSMIPLLCFVYKRELHYIPFFGWSIALMSMVPIDRSSGKEALEQVVSRGGARLREGWNMVLFPEGTRVRVGETRRYKAGGALLAIRTNTPVIPVAHNAGDCWPRDTFIKRPGLITLSFGQPIFPDGLSVEQLNAKIEQWVEGEMRRLFPHQYAKASRS
jgi:1-acyl-sn-glycerol-3-phosphate acyltransferase